MNRCVNGDDLKGSEARILIVVRNHIERLEELIARNPVEVF